MRLVDYENDILKNEAKLAILTQKRLALEDHANALKAEGLDLDKLDICLLYTSPSPRDATLSRMPSSA